METQTPTSFRANIYRILEKVATGFEVRIKTKKGNIILISEKNLNKKQASRKEGLLKPKARGRINGTLDDADERLRNYIRMPS
jgi:hypothetical protein